MGTDADLERTTAELREAGCVAAGEEAVELLGLAAGDEARLQDLIMRRCSGEPLAWLVGTVRFCGETVFVHPGVYVPRWQSEPLAIEAVSRLPADGVAVDLCTGAGAIAVVLTRRRPHSRVVACDLDPLAVACARANRVEVFEGDMTSVLPDELTGQVDVVTAVVPYVPSDELRLLPRDVIALEPRHALDGGRDGTRFLFRAVLESVRLLQPGGSLLLELGGNQADLLRPVLGDTDYWDVQLLFDEDNEVRALQCRH